MTSEMMCYVELLCSLPISSWSTLSFSSSHLFILSVCVHLCVRMHVYMRVCACALVGYTQELFSPSLWKPQQQAPLPTHLDGPQFF